MSPPAKAPIDSVAASGDQPPLDQSLCLNPLRAARAAVVFLTRIPAGGFPYTAAEWRWSAAWFPAVGALVGSLTGAMFALARPIGDLVAAALAVTIGLFVTGAFHEDGLADTADALGGAYHRDRLFAILKDSHIGVFGAAALTMSLVLRVALLARLGSQAPWALVLVGALSRTSPVWLMAALPYVTAPESARSRPLVRGGWPQAIAASLCAAAVVGAVMLDPGFAFSALIVWILATTVALACLCGWRFRVRAGGITGDFLGATQQLTECMLLLVFALGQAGGSP